MRVLVTGGAGFIASNVVDKLIAKGNDVVIIDNLSTGYKDNVNPKARFYEVDMTNKEKLEEVFTKEKPDKVVHAAAQVQVVKSVEDPIFDAKINILGGINVIECCKKYEIKRIVYLCTGGALYGEPEYLPADENHPINPISPYGASKHTVEHYLYQYQNNYGLDFISVRFANVYGTRDDLASKRVIPLFIYNFIKGKPPVITGDGSQGRDFIFVDDVANAVIIALDANPKDRYFNIGTGTVITIKELFYVIRDILELDIEPKFIEARTGEVQEIYLNAKRAKEQLGWEAKIGIKEGMEETIKWFKENLDRIEKRIKP